MMMKPAVPKPTAAFMAAKRAECKKASPCDDDEVKEAMREQGPFWMSQASIAYNVPNSGIDKDHPTIDEIPVFHEHYEYNGVNFNDSPVKYVNTMNHGGGLGAAGKYLAMGSFFNNSENTPPSGKYDPRHQVVGRYFLVEVKRDFTIPNPNSCLDDKDGTLFAPAGSFILSFSGTEIDAQAVGLVLQDKDWQPGPLPSLPEYEGYQNMIEAQKTMFDGTDDKCTPEANQMMGVTTALETKAGFKDANGHIVPGKQITIVGHSLGGAHAQLAAVQIATKYKAKVRVITFESILAFTPEGAKNVVDNLIVGGPDGAKGENAEPTLMFPAEAGKITAQRWVEDDSPLTAAPLLFPAGWCCPIPILNIFNPFSCCFGPPACTWKDKYRLVGCWPCNGNLGNGYISRALIMRGFQAGAFSGPPSRDVFGCWPKGGGRLCRGCHKDTLVYEDKKFVLDISDERTYKTKGASRLPLIGNCFPVTFRIANHQQKFLLWMLYKGAYQNEDAPNSIPTLRKVSQYVPQVYGPAPCHA